jgi:hypothetical protein
LNPFESELKKIVVESNYEEIVKVDFHSKWKIGEIKKLDIRLKLLKNVINVFKMFLKTAETRFSFTNLSFPKKIIIKNCLLVEEMRKLILR